MVWQLEQADADVGNAAATWFGTFHRESACWSMPSRGSRAVRVRGSQRIVVVYVAVGLQRRRGVCTDQGQTCGAVVKLAVGPTDRVMAGGALECRECRGHVVWHPATECLRAVPGGQVAAVAIGVGSGQIVIVADMAVRAGDDLTCRCQLVRAREREAGGAVIKGGVGPGNRIVTGRTVGRREKQIPAVECVGLFVVCQVVRWQPELPQSVG